MGRRGQRAWLVAALGGSLVLGCQASKNYPDEPLLQSKKPTAGKSTQAAPVQIAHADPPAPRVSNEALATMPSTPPASLASGPPLLGAPETHPASSTPAPLVATPAVRSMSRAEVTATPAVRQRVSGTFDHDPDYAWLQGVIDKHYQGRYYLRYCDHRHEDSWGGKVCLDDDPRLAQFQNDDVVFVEGAIVPEADPQRHEAWKRYPRYQIRSIKLVQRPNDVRAPN